MLEVLHREHGLSAYRIAEETGLNQPTVHRVQSGESANPRETTVSAIRRLFERYAPSEGVPMWHLFEVTACTTEVRTYRVPARSEAEALSKVDGQEIGLATTQEALSRHIAPDSIVRTTRTAKPLEVRSVPGSVPSVSVPVPRQAEPMVLSVAEARQLLSDLAGKLE